MIPARRGAAAEGSDLPPQTLRRSFWDAISWLAVSKLLTQALGFGRSIILARLLAPDDYGLWGMATLVLSGIFAMTHFNLGASAVAHRFESESELRRSLDTIWTADLFRRAAISIVLALLAQPASAYFGDRRLFPVLLIVSAYPLALGFENIGMWRLHKEMSFRRVAVQQQTAELVTTVLAVWLAWATRDYTALVAGQWAHALCVVGLSYVVCEYRPRLQIDRAALRRSFDFGKHMFIIGVLGFVMTQFDNLVVGRYLGASVLGLYILAYRLVTLPGEFAGSVFATVLFPLFAKVSHEQPDKAMRALFPAASAVAMMLIGILGPVKLAAGPIVHLVYGSKWEAAVPFLSVLAILGVFRGLSESIGPFLRAVGRPDLDARGKIVEAGVFVPLTLWLVPRYGGLGAAWAGVTAFALAYAVRFVLVLRFDASGRLRAAAALARPLLIGAGAYAVCRALLSLGMGPWAAAACFEALFLVAMLALDAVLRSELALLWNRLRPA